MTIERKAPLAWLTYSAEAGRQDGGDVIVAVEAGAFDVRLQVLSQGAKVQSMAFLSPAAAGDLRDMLTEALGDPAQARGEAHALRMIAEALQVPEAERHDGGIMRAIERLQADRDRLADIVEHKYGTDECDGCADRDLRIEELEAQLLGRSTSSRMDPTLAALQRRLEHSELQHLRDHARQLADRVEEMEEQLVVLRGQAADAEDRAEFWRGALRDVEDQLAEDLRLAMTTDGRPVVVEDAGDA